MPLTWRHTSLKKDLNTIIATLSTESSPILEVTETKPPKAPFRQSFTYRVYSTNRTKRKRSRLVSLRVRSTIALHVARTRCLMRQDVAQVAWDRRINEISSFTFSERPILTWSTLTNIKLLLFVRIESSSSITRQLSYTFTTLEAIIYHTRASNTIPMHARSSYVSRNANMVIKKIRKFTLRLMDALIPHK